MFATMTNQLSVCAGPARAVQPPRPARRPDLRERLVPLDPWLLKSEAARPFRLYCFSDVGGSAAGYADWVGELGSEVEICAVQLPGRGARFHEGQYTALDQFIPVLAAVLAAQPAQDFAFFGQGLGALIAFELARYLAWHGHAQPTQLIVSACAAPRYRSVLGSRARGPELPAHRDPLEVSLPTLRADMAIAESYRYRTGPLLDLPLSVFAGTPDEVDTPDQARGWRDETSGLCDVYWFDGGRDFLRSERARTLALLRDLLAPAARAA